MARLAKKVIIGASLAAGLSVVAGTPAQALDITFHGEDNIKSYTHQDGNLWVGADASYLTDGELTTNVELWFDSEDVGSNVGFTAIEGAHTVSVESVTAADWVNFQDDWLDGLFATYEPLGELWDELGNTPFLGSTLQAGFLDTFKTMGGYGDPNIAEFSLDETGAVDIKMAGWGNLWTKIDTTALPSLWASDPLIASLAQDLRDEFINLIPDLEISEIAKVTINGEVQYAYSFNAVDSGFVAKDDGMSYSGIYSWNRPGTPVAAVPEPSTMLGLMAVGGLVAASKRKSNKNA